MVGRTMVPRRCPCPSAGTCEYGTLHSKRDRRYDFIQDIDGEIILHELGEPSAVTSIFISEIGKQEGQSQKTAGFVNEGPQAKKRIYPL